MALVQQTEQPKPIVISGEHLLAAAESTLGAKAANEQVRSFREALGKQGGVKLADRALKVVQRDKKASYDGKNPEVIVENVRNNDVKENAQAKIVEVQTIMATIDILRLDNDEAQYSLFVRLKNEKKIGNNIDDIDALLVQARTHLVKSTFFQEWYKQNGYPPGREADLAQNFFLYGEMADTVQAVMSERVGLLRGKIAELPGIKQSEREQINSAQKTSEAIKKGAEEEIKKQAKDIVANAGGDEKNITAAIEREMVAAAAIEDKSLRAIRLTDILAKSSNISADMLRGIHIYEDNMNELSRLKQQNGTNQERILQLKKDTDDARANNDSVPFLEALTKYHTIQTQVQSGEMKNLTQIYQENTSSELKNRLQLLGTAAVEGASSQEEINRNNAEQNLNVDIDQMLNMALHSAVRDQIDTLSSGAQLAAQDAFEEAEKSGEKEEALMFAQYRGSMAGGKEGIFERQVSTKSGKNIKKETVINEILHVDNLEETLRVIAANDTTLEADGTKFMMAYKAGLFSEDDSSAKNVLSGKLSAAKALVQLNENKQQKLNKLCTEEQMDKYRKHVFAEFARAQDYIQAGGMFKDGGVVAQMMRRMKGINIKIDGDPAKLGALTMHWDKIMETHLSEVEAAIDHSNAAKALRDRLNNEGWIAGDQKKKNILYLLMMLFGLISFPALGVGMGVSGIGAGVLSLAGGAVGKKVADRVTS